MRAAMERRRVSPGREGLQHLRERDATQGIADHVVDQAPVRSHAAALRNTALAVVLAAFGDRQRTFHRFDDLHQGDVAGGAREPVTAVHAAQAFNQACLRQWLENLANSRCFQASLFGQFACAEHLIAACRQDGQHHGGVIGEFGDAQHGRAEF